MKHIKKKIKPTELLIASNLVTPNNVSDFAAFDISVLKIPIFFQQ
jgi:hypothetical protein